MKKVREFLEEKTNKKAEKLLDKVMNSQDGGKLANAMDDGDEDKAVKILKKNRIKGNDLDDVLELMFGSL